MTDLAVENQPSEEQSGELTAGRMLKQARERQQVDMAVLAAMLKVSEHKIRALESDQLDVLPDLAFARSLTGSIARMLEIDPAPVLAKLPKAVPSAARTVYEPLNAPYQPQSEGGSLGRAVSTILQRRYLWVVLALLLAAVVLAMLPQLQGEQRSESTTTTIISAAGTVTSEVVSPALPSGVPSTAPVVPLASAVPAAPASAASASVDSAVPALPAASSAQPAASAALIASGDLSFATTQDSWIQVQDAAGKTLFSRILKAGENVALSGVAPYRVVVGSVTGVSLSVRGQAFDLAAAAKNRTTARFSVP